jgi:hypothetical protein
VTSVSERTRPSAARTARVGLSRAALVDRAPARRPVLVVAPVAAAWAAVVVLVVVSLPVVVTWVTAPHIDQSWAQTLQACAAGWLVAHAVPITLGPVTVSLLPLGLLVVPLLAGRHAARWAVRSARVAGARERAVLIGTGAAVYVGVAFALARAASGDGLEISPGYSAAAAAVLWIVVAAWAMWTDGDLRPAVAARLAPPVRATVRAGVAAAVALLGAGALLATLGLALALPTATAVTGALGVDGVGGPMALLLGLGYVPVAAVWGTAYLLGPGVIVGPDVAVAPWAGAGSADLPAFPLLAALPQTAPAWTWGLLVLPVAAGVLAGRIIARSDHRGHPSAGRALATSLGAGAVAAALVAAACAAASGSLGDERLALLGPDPLACGAVVWALVSVGALAGLLTVRRAPA